MARPALPSGRLLEPYGDVRPRGMVAHDRTRLTGGLTYLAYGRSIWLNKCCGFFASPVYLYKYSLVLLSLTPFRLDLSRVPNCPAKLIATFS